MGLTYHYAFSAPGTTTAAVLEGFLHDVEADAKALGFDPVLVVDAAFDTPERQKFARQLTTGARLAVTEHEETRATTELGAAQKDTARELSAKLASLKGIVWVGVAMFLFGLASIFYPPLKLIIGSVTTSVAVLVGGIALMVLPSLIVGNELLILGGVGAAVGVWFFAHRHGQLRGLVDAAKATVDTPEKPA